MTSPIPTKLYLETTLFMGYLFTCFKKPQIDPFPRVECPSCYIPYRIFLKTHQNPKGQTLTLLAFLAATNFPSIANTKLLHLRNSHLYY